MANGISFSGKKLAELRRKEAWMSQEKLAREIGISKTRMSAIETADRAVMYLDHFKRMAEVFKVEPNALLKMLEAPPEVPISGGPSILPAPKQSSVSPPSVPTSDDGPKARPSTKGPAGRDRSGSRSRGKRRPKEDRRN